MTAEGRKNGKGNLSLSLTSGSQQTGEKRSEARGVRKEK